MTFLQFLCGSPSSLLSRSLWWEPLSLSVKQQILIQDTLWASCCARLHGDTENDLVESSLSKTAQSGWSGKKWNKEGSAGSWPPWPLTACTRDSCQVAQVQDWLLSSQEADPRSEAAGELPSWHCYILLQTHQILAPVASPSWPGCSTPTASWTLSPWDLPTRPPSTTEHRQLDVGAPSPGLQAVLFTQSLGHAAPWAQISVPAGPAGLPPPACPAFLPRPALQPRLHSPLSSFSDGYPLTTSCPRAGCKRAESRSS